MHPKLREALIRCETDLGGAMERFMKNEPLYLACLGDFLADGSMEQLTAALSAGDTEKACLAAHTIKGMAGNMGFVPLYHAAAELVEILRGERTGDAQSVYERVSRCYKRLVAGIRPYVEQGEEP